ncbi:MAG: GNAT family N-acetyltransferase [Thermoleophilia bacterium]|nr:GNAT family N-acetyltransferase [Thermoleophilia bacterium]
MTAPTLGDGVVVLDAFVPEDAAAHLAGEDEEHARRFGWWPQRSTEAMVAAFIERAREQWATGGRQRPLAVRDAATGELVGGCEIRLPAPGFAELSYWTFPAYRRRGFASRALALACRYADKELGVERAELLIEPDNAASLAVARRAGFVRVGEESDDRGRRVVRFRRR